MSQKIWFITGVSSGFGQSIAQAAMQRGHFAVATFRQREQAEAFTQSAEGKGLGLVVDVTDSESLVRAFGHIEEQFGRLDVLVNNAGIGYIGAVEEADMAGARYIFEVNVFGALLATQLALPIFRRQGSGHIFQMSSGAGVKSTPGFGIYNASKFALEGFSEALFDEVRPLGIRVTIVEPGPFRTLFAASSSLKVAEKEIADYAATAGAFRARVTGPLTGTQEGDPDKGAHIILDVAEHPNPPLRLPLGKMVLGNIRAKIDLLQNDLDNWRTVSASAVYE